MRRLMRSTPAIALALLVALAAGTASGSPPPEPSVAMPMVLSLADRGATGLPIIRPLFLGFPEQPEAYREWQSYLYGPDILVAPLWRKGQTEHTVWLPAGRRWVDGWTGQAYEGGQRVTVPAPLYKIPVFLREGLSTYFGTNLEKLWVESLKLAFKRPGLATLQRGVR